MNEQKSARRLTINQALAISGLSNNYVRKAIKNGDLKVVKELVPGTQNNWRNVILNFDEWRATRNHTQREDGRTKYAFYMTADEEAKVREMLKELDCVQTLTKAFVKKDEESEAE